MTVIILDGSSMHEPDDFYAQIRQHEATPEWFGGNLDALFDLLIAIWPKPIRVEWHNHVLARDVLGSYYERLVTVFTDAAAHLKKREQELTLICPDECNLA